MSENEPPARRKRLEFYPTGPLNIAFRKFMNDEGFVAESKALEFLTREGLQERDLLPRRKKQQP